MSNDKTQQSQSGETVTLPLASFFHMLLRLDEDNIYDEENKNYKEFIRCHPLFAKYLQSRDPHGHFIHVEFPGDFNKGQLPQVWEINNWRTSYAAYEKRRKISEADRQKSYLLRIKLEELYNAIICHHGYIEEHGRGLAMDMARAAIRNKAVKICKDEYNVDISSVIDNENINNILL